MSVLSRTDKTIVGRWWWTVDRSTLAATAILLACGVLLILAATPPVAERLNRNPYHLARLHVLHVPVAFAIMVGVSLMTPRAVRRLAFLIFALAFLGMCASLWIGLEIKGARRWIDLGVASVQPSEFIKPSFAVVAAWFFADHAETRRPGGRIVAVALFALVVGLLILQPDVGMALVVCAAWFAQFLLSGLGLSWAALLAAAAVLSMVLAYFMLPHVAYRIDRFLDPESGDSFQVDTSLSAFINGSLFGRGPGEGTIKEILPDAHSDFIFAVAGEEFGLIACLGLLILFAVVVMRGLFHALQETSLYAMIAITGLVVQIGLQAAINMGSSLRLIPAKGITLPFISYGGSSMMAVAVALGMLLAFTRRRPGGEPL